MSARVELHQAWSWVCPVCNLQNWHHAIAFEPSEDEKAEIAKHTGLQPYEVQTGQWLVAPDEVCCKRCLAKFETNPPGE